MTTIKLRRDTAANWTSVNPVLAEGEVGIDVSNNYIKIGDGSTAWNSLAYSTITPEVLQVVLSDKEDVFDTQSPLEITYTSNGIGTLDTTVTMNPDGTTTIGDVANYYGFWYDGFGTSLPQTDYWRFNFRIKRVSASVSNQPFFAIDDTTYNFVELYFSDYNFPIDTWVQCSVIHQAGASDIQFEYTINGTTTTVQDVLASGYTLTSNKYVNWMGTGITVITDLSWNTNYQLEPYGARGVFTDRNLGVDNTAFDGQWISSKQNIITTSTSLNGSSNLAYTVEVPNDGYVYEAMIRGEVETGSASGNFCILSIQGTEITSDWMFVCGARTRTTSSNNGYGTVIIPIKRANNNLTVRRSSNYTGNIPANGLVMLGYRRVGTNS